MTNHLTNNIAISRMTNDSAQEAFSLACEVFVEASAPHTAMKVSIEEYRNYMRLPFEAMRGQGLSLIAKDTSNDKLVGCIVACDYTTLGQNSAIIPDSLKPVNALLSSLEETYRKNRQPHPGQYMLVDMAVVTPTARGQGIYRKLREAVHRVGREAGYSYVVGELSSTATQQLCINRFNHKVCAEIEFSSFKYQDQKPFSTITSPKCIVLVEGKL